MFPLPAGILVTTVRSNSVIATSWSDTSVVTPETFPSDVMTAVKAS